MTSPAVHWGATPSPSPVLYKPYPVSDVLSVELLRRICAPFVEQLVQAIHLAIQAELDQHPIALAAQPILEDHLVALATSDEPRVVDASRTGGAPAFRSLFHPGKVGKTSLVSAVGEHSSPHEPGSSATSNSSGPPSLRTSPVPPRTTPLQRTVPLSRRHVEEQASSGSADARMPLQAPASQMLPFGACSSQVPVKVPVPSTSSIAGGSPHGNARMFRTAAVMGAPAVKQKRSDGIEFELSVEMSPVSPGSIVASAASNASGPPIFAPSSVSAAAAVIPGVASRPGLCASSSSEDTPGTVGSRIAAVGGGSQQSSSTLKAEGRLPAGSQQPVWLEWCHTDPARRRWADQRSPDVSPMPLAMLPLDAHCRPCGALAVAASIQPAQPTLEEGDAEDAEETSDMDQDSSKVATSKGEEREKSNTVCKHWKTKGSCRYEALCRFQHPPDLRCDGTKSSKHAKRRHKNRSVTIGLSETVMPPVLLRSPSLTDSGNP